MDRRLQEYLLLKRREGMDSTLAVMELLEGLKKFNEKGYLDENSDNYEILKDIVIQSPQKKKETIYEALRNAANRYDFIANRGFTQLLMKITDPLVLEEGKTFIPYDYLGESALEFALTYEKNTVNYYEHNNKNFEIISLLNEVLGTKLNIEDKNFIYQSEDQKNYYDLVLVQPPMGMRLDVESIAIEEPLSGRKITSESASLIKSIEAAKQGGYIICTLPQSFLFNTLNKEIRNLVLEKCDVMMIVDAPKKSLLATNIGLSIMVLKKKTKKNQQPKEFIAATFDELSIEDEAIKQEVQQLLKLWTEFIKEGK